MKHLLKTVTHEIKKNLLDYLILLTAGILFIVLLQFLSGSKILLFTAVLVFTSFYILWGIYHHAMTKTLRFKNVLEYVLIAFIILFLIEAILF